MLTNGRMNSVRQLGLELTETLLINSALQLRLLQFDNDSQPRVSVAFLSEQSISLRLRLLSGSNLLQGPLLSVSG